MSTEFQSNAVGVLEQLGFESQGADMPGADVFVKITPETVEKIAQHVKDGTFVVVSSDSIAIAMP